LSNSYYNAPEPEGPGPIGYLALVLAWACPGLGHFILGERVRGIVFAVFIHGLFALGLLFAGIRAINPPDQAIWTYTQFLTGWPMLIANRLEHDSRHLIKEELPDKYKLERGNREAELGRQFTNDERMAFAKDFIARNPLFAHHPKVQDIGAVYCGIAGMLNLLVMFDVLLRITGSVREDPLAVKKKQRKASPVVGAGVAGTPAAAASVPLPAPPVPPASAAADPTAPLVPPGGPGEGGRP
jgi:hypothetical protein